MSDLFTLSCCIRGHPPESIFNIKISPNEEVGTVKQKIKDSDSDTFRGVAAISLRLYKLNVLVPFHGLSAVTLSTSGEPLNDALNISDVFATQPHERHIHLIVDYPLILYYVQGATDLDHSHIRISGNERLGQLRTRIKAKHEGLRSTSECCIAFYKPLASTTCDELEESIDPLPVGERFDMNLLVSNAFLDVPVLEDICIIVEVTELKSAHVIVQQPNLSHGEKRLRSPSSDLEKTKRRKKVPDDIAAFHSKIWDKKSHAHATIFVTTPVERPQLTGAEVPSQCCVMKSPPYGSGSTHLSGVFIRNEYVLAVEDIVAFYEGENFSDNSNGNDDEADTTMGHYDEVDMTMETPFDAAKPSVAQTQFPVTIANPFLAPDFPFKGKKPGVIITGAPGIGKSVLLEFILHLRNLAGRPTIFVLDDKRVDLFTSDGVSRFEGSQINKSKLPPSVWALVDSNTDLVGVPEWVRSLGCFIVQAASPRSDHLHWGSKEVGVSRYILKMWSLEEVLAARMLQDGSLPSETQLKTFFECYVPSARTAYSFASRIQDLESELRSYIDCFSVEDVTNIVHDMASLQMDAELPHQLFIIQPGETRSSLVINFASQYVSDKLVAALEQKVSNAAQVLFEVCNHNPITKALAGQLLDAVVRGVFTRGAAWSIRQMEISPNKGKVNQHWKITSSKPYADQYLIVGDPAQPIVKICDECPDDGIVYDTFAPFPLYATTDKVTNTGYYLPTSKVEATFDAFYYDADRKEATVLQATVSTSHAVKAEGLQLLQEVGVESARYVTVTGPQDEFDLSVPKAYDGVFLKEKYHLVLPKLD